MLFKDYLVEQRFEEMPSANPSNGFHGTINDAWTKKGGWSMAFSLIRHITGASAIDVRNWLDSPFGRHLADYFNSSEDVMDAVKSYGGEKTIKRQMNTIVKNRQKFDD
jgi:hypothetical protein